MRTKSGGVFKADKVIITVPVKLLQMGMVEFKPELPAKRKEAIAGVKIWDGFKVFLEFKEQFYPTATGFTVTPEKGGHKVWYDAAYGQSTARHIMGYFMVGDIAQPYVESTDAELIEKVLSEIDALHDGKATPNYVQHVFQNWSAEPFARGAYMQYYESAGRMKELGKPVGDKLFFAGDAYFNGRDWSSVHVAARAAKRAVSALVS